jgi:hypothetical protein
VVVVPDVVEGVEVAIDTGTTGLVAPVFPVVLGVGCVDVAVEPDVVDGVDVAVEPVVGEDVAVEEVDVELPLPVGALGSYTFTVRIAVPVTPVASVAV